ncbi:MAG: DUF885 family protein [Planctomycetes bacterium]|nr:DUF885 family protein [Planctomycetota bacterium]MCB9911064.1 DUF885 family protein [Planctomycetota bacterium]MCB9911469.1 DUF885 family protein [Planctomycetota bacterium]HPF13966.1 DUF885 family protein [Planctomycetota bacterium]
MLTLACSLFLGFAPPVLAPAWVAQSHAPRPATTAELCIQWGEDLGALDRLFDFPLSEARWQAFEGLFDAWQAKLEAVDFASLDRTGQIDLILLQDDLEHERDQLATERGHADEDGKYLDFAEPLVALLEDRTLRNLPDPELAAQILQAATDRLGEWREEHPAGKEGAEAPSPSQMRRAARTCGRLRRALREWYDFGAEYDPLFTFWCKAPWKGLDGALEKHATYLEKDLGGIDPKDEDRLLGEPIGRERLMAELRHERIAYTPEELIAIAEREFAWCDAARAKAATAMGLDGDWRAAQEQVRALHVAPGQQPVLIRDLADEAVRFLEERDLVTIPDQAKQVWRMEMMSPERQRFSPYFTGGEVISISYPTTEMDQASKMQSMRGNNRHFSRATVHHELIPGHHLQGYMASRWNTQRSRFRTPFLVEGWALYWELRLWDLGFQQSPEDEIGMLFWRSHRCARILFSLNYQLGNWTAEQCVDFLVERVGHDRRNATAEVRRSIQGGYGPLYQVAYMIGGMQLMELQRELVGTGLWTDKNFHDTVLQQGSIPVDLIRDALTEGPLQLRQPVTWRFAE